MKNFIIEDDITNAKSLARDALQMNMDLNQVIEAGFVPGIETTGDLWEKGEYFFPELISSAECMRAVIQIRKPGLGKANIQASYLGQTSLNLAETEIQDKLRSHVLADARKNVISELQDIELQLQADS